MDEQQENRPKLGQQKKGILGELWSFMRVRKKFWLAPIIIVLLFLGMLMFVAASAGPLSPFVYMM